MQFGIVGYGKMGRAIESAAGARGHEVLWIVDGESSSRDTLRRSTDAVFEFTRPDVAEANVRALLERGHSVVCGTTGWTVPEEFGTLAREHGVAFLRADNFSIGVTWLRRLVEAAAAWAGDHGGFTPWIHERHHAAKRDAPSGTARMLAAAIAAADPRGLDPTTDASARGGAGTFPIAATRAGHEPGTHTIGFDGPHESIELIHRARGREGFASGAVIAAERLAGRTGCWTLDELLDAPCDKGREDGS